MTSIAATGVDTSAFLDKTLMGLTPVFSEQTELDKLLLIAPPMPVDAWRNVAIAEETQPMLDERGPQNPAQEVSWDASASAAGLGFANFEINIDYYHYGATVISDHRRAQALAYGVDPSAAWTRTRVHQNASIAWRKLGIVLAATGNYNAALQSTSMDISVPSERFLDKILTAKRAMRGKSISTKNLVIAFSDLVMQYIMDLDEVRDAVAISGFTTAGSEVRRTGVVTEDQVITWLKTKAGFADVLVIETQTIRSSGTATSVLEDDIYILTAEPNGAAFIRSGVLKNFGAAFGGPKTHVVNNPEGVMHRMECAFGFGLPSNLLAFVFKGVTS
jgi:hypothetical protein